LGYCPGTIAGAIGQGSLDALIGGTAGIVIGAGIFAALHPWLSERILDRGRFGTITLPEVFDVNPWVVVIPAAALLTALLVWMEATGL
jgi:hypothetical protein